jgi:hypothetical protein
VTPIRSSGANDREPPLEPGELRPRVLAAVGVVLGGLRRYVKMNSAVNLPCLHHIRGVTRHHVTDTLPGTGAADRESWHFPAGSERKPQGGASFAAVDEFGQQANQRWR